MKIVFMGTPDFSVTFLNTLCVKGFRPIAVVTQPDRPAGRGMKMQAPPVKQAALELEIPLWQPESLKDEIFLKDMRALEPDLFVVVAFSILPKDLLAVPRLGSVNVHGSLLPKYRGAAPIQWAVAHGETETGVTIFLLDTLMDHGPVLCRRRCNIDLTDTSEDVFHKLEKLGAEAMLEALNQLKTGSYTPLEQDHGQATKAPKLKKEDGLINWSMPAVSIHNRVRAFYPYPICYSFFRGKTLRVLKSLPLIDIDCEACKDALPGEMTFFEEGLYVRTGDGWLQILSLQLEGKKPLEPLEFYNGLQDKHRLILSSSE